MASEADSQALWMPALPESLQLIVCFLAAHVPLVDRNIRSLRSVTNANVEYGPVEPGVPAVGRIRCASSASFGLS